MKILFLDQSGKLGGAELSLADVAKLYQETCLVGLFADGPFRHLLEQQHIPVQVLATQPINVRRDSSLIENLSSLNSIAPLVIKIVKIARHFDLIYTNTQKALVIGAIASCLSNVPLVYHLRDILSADHFSSINRSLAVSLANRFASAVIANSKATQAAFIKAGGCPEITEVIYNGFEPEKYCIQDSQASNISQLRQQLGLEKQFVVGHFGRLCPWKGQHILLEALAHCSSEVTAIFVGDAFFGEQTYVEQLHRQMAELKLEKRVHFLGFRSDIAPLMAACDLIVHTSTAPEPFGRVIVEAMLCGRPIIAARAGGVLELVEQGKTGWLVAPGNSLELAKAITTCRQNPVSMAAIAAQAQRQASERFRLSDVNQQIAQVLSKISRR